MTDQLRPLSLGLRLLLATIGAAAILASILVGGARLRELQHASPAMPAALIALLCAVVIWGGLHLLRGAYRGRIAVRLPRGVRHRVTTSTRRE